MTHDRVFRNRLPQWVCHAAALLAAGSACAQQSCDASKNCDSYVEVSADGRGGCTYQWPTQTYVVAKNSQPQLLWRLRDPNFAWDGSLGVTLVSPINLPSEDLDGGAVLPYDKSTFRWIAVQTPARAGSKKTFDIDFVIKQISPPAACTPAQGSTIRYTIELQR